jgi:transcriptional regulator with XRE-family HTH domain
MNIEKLKELREQRGLLQKEVAIALGLSQVRYNRYETGEREPDHRMLKQIAAYFNVSIDYLLDAAPPDGAGIIDIRGLSEEAKQIMLTQMDAVKRLDEARRNNEQVKGLQPKSAHT